MNDTEKKLPAEDLEHFERQNPSEWEKEHKNIENNHYAKLLQLRERDIDWRITRRPVYGFVLLLLLFTQNAIVFGLVITSYLAHNLEELSLVLGIIITGTLVETAVTVRLIIQWLFSNIDYAKL